MQITKPLLDAWVEYRYTSPEIVCAIFERSHDLADAERLWASPTEAERDAIVTRARKLHEPAIDPDWPFLHWGDALVRSVEDYYKVHIREA